MPTVLEVCGRWSHMWQKSETAVMNKHTIASENSTPQSQLGVESGWIVCKFKHCIVNFKFAVIYIHQTC